LDHLRGLSVLPPSRILMAQKRLAHKNLYEYERLLKVTKTLPG
jgi:hypothetical protein